ncbi:hypothetical protein VBY74_08505 [Tenacibaculum ascidiaceicola]|uniref:hypothetical protein n=1 Tax=Tenacibaculum ascidiaceicola TaxID=1699411 RepID=UPI0039E9D2BD
MKQNKETLKQFFETGDKPTQQQYADLIDSYVDAKQPEGEANRRFVIDETGEVSIASEQQVSEYTLSPISGTNTVDLLKDGVSVSQIDLTPYLDNTNLARLVSGTVDTNGLATFTRDDNSTFMVDLSNLKDTVPQYQAGSNITIDTTDPLQPIINATAGSGGTTDLSYDVATRTVASSSGTDAVIPLAAATNAGLQKANFYEEGTFTVTVVDNGGGATYSQSIGHAKYVRVGNKVSISIQISITGTSGTPTGRLDLQTTGLPPIIDGNTAFTVGGLNGFSSNFYSAYLKVNAGSTSVLSFGIQESLDGSNISTFTGTTITSGIINASGTYITNVYTP